MIQLRAVGDIALHATLRSGTAELGQQLGHDALLLGNLEMVLCDPLPPAEKLITLRGNPTLAGELIRMGLHAVSLANNHMLDFGVAGMVTTERTVGAEGIACLGVGADADAARAPRVLRTGTGRLALIGLCSALPNNFAAGSATPGIAPVRVVTSIQLDPVTTLETPGISPYVQTSYVVADVEAACAVIAEAAPMVDAVVVAIHWGVPRGWVAEIQGELADYQRPLGRALIDAGAAAVIGHHPHVVHGVELYRQRPIFYSLGNFAFHPIQADSVADSGTYPPYRLSTLNGERNSYGAVARLAWESSSQPSQVGMSFVRLDADGEPRWATPAEAEKCLGWLRDSAAQYGTVPVMSSHDGRPEVVFQPGWDPGR
jgi:hypothetical protein